jgi:hypothetical protein
MQKARTSTVSAAALELLLLLVRGGAGSPYDCANPSKFSDVPPPNILLSGINCSYCAEQDNNRTDSEQSQQKRELTCTVDDQRC